MKRLVLSALSFSLALSAFGAEASMEKIDTRCQMKWHGNFQMQKFCIDTEVDAARTVIAFMEDHALMDADPGSVVAAAEGGDPYAQIFRHCLRRWHDDIGLHYSMMAFCIETQLDALGQMQQRSRR